MRSWPVSGCAVLQELTDALVPFFDLRTAWHTASERGSVQTVMYGRSQQQSKEVVQQMDDKAIVDNRFRPRYETNDVYLLIFIVEQKFGGIYAVVLAV